MNTYISDTSSFVSELQLDGGESRNDIFCTVLFGHRVRSFRFFMIDRRRYVNQTKFPPISCRNSRTENVLLWEYDVIVEYILRMVHKTLGDQNFEQTKILDGKTNSGNNKTLLNLLLH
jgi:hypothetical protein